MNIVAVESVADLKPGDIPVPLLEPSLPGPWSISTKGPRIVMVVRDVNGTLETAWIGKDYSDAIKIRERLNTLDYLRG